MIEIYWRQRQKSKYTVCSEPILADIETAHDKDYTHTWMVTCQLRFAGSYKVVRTPSEFIEYLKDMIDTFSLDESRRVYCYFHNLSFDFSYLLPWVQLYLPGYENRSGIYDGRNRVITYTQGAFEFRCSYLLSACSLERWCEEMNAAHKKKVGLYDYNKELFQDSEIDDESAIYDEYDVLSMDDCLRAQMEAYNDTTATIPLTSTAYIRRILRKSCQYDPDYRNDVFLRSMIDAQCNNILLMSYAGGYTHENRYFKGKTIRAGVLNEWKSKRLTLDMRGKKLKHRDFRSHYPTQFDGLLPWGRADYFYSYEERDKYETIYNHKLRIEDLIKMYPEYTTVSMIRIKDMRLKSEGITMPFMQISKMHNMSPGFRYENDNGRALRTDGEFTTYIDNLTLKIINEQYKFSYVILKVYRFENTECPKAIKSVIDDLFKKKSDYKILYGKCRKEYGEFDERTITALFNLNQSKKLLNAIYGCCSTAIVRSKDDMDWLTYYNGEVDDPYISIKPETLEEKQEKISKYYNSRNSFLPYQVGISVCAAARYELYEYIKTIGYENCLYADTDSLFYISDDEVEMRVEALNEEKHKTAGHITNSEGVDVYYNVFEEEPELKAFRGLHSKCYAVIDKDEELVATIAGVPRRTIIGMQGEEPIYLTREEELAGITKEDKLAGRDKFDPYKAIDNLEVGQKFYVNSGVTAKYVREKYPGVIEVDGHLVETSGGCIIKRVEYKEIRDPNNPDYDAIFSDLYMDGL